MVVVVVPVGVTEWWGWSFFFFFERQKILLIIKIGEKQIRGNRPPHPWVKIPRSNNKHQQTPKTHNGQKREKPKTIKP